jgi:hypothetical protein
MPARLGRLHEWTGQCRTESALPALLWHAGGAPMTGNRSKAVIDVGYIRGAPASPVNDRRVARLLVAGCAVVLAALTIILTVDGARANSRMSHLQTRGVRVDAVVTGCVGMASGTGITQSGYTCRASFMFGERRYNDVVGGTNDLYAPGQILSGIADPQRPTVLYTAQAVSTDPSPLRAYVAAAVCLLLLLLLLGPSALSSRNRPRNARNS